MRLKLLTAILLFMPGMLFAQSSVADWFRHPSMAAAAQIIEGYNFQEKKFSTRPLAMLKVSFGNPDKGISANLIMDVATGRFLTASAAWQPLPQIGVQIGLQKMLFLYDNSFVPYMYGLMGYSQATNYLAGYSSDLTGINSRSRDVGISLRGSFWPRERYSVLSYALGVFNGEGASFRDSNKGKDIHVRLILQPVESLKFTLGAMNGYYTHGPEALFERHHHHLDEGLACRRRLSGGVWFDNGKWFARAEDIYGITDGMHSNGIMAIAGWKFLPKFEAAARVDSFKRDLDDPLSTSTKLDFCLTRHITTDGTMYVAVQYGHTFYSDPSLPGQDSIMLCLNIAFLRNL